MCLYSMFTSKHPPLLTNACEQINIIKSMINKTIPVGFAAPPIKPNNPGLLVNIHSETV